MDRQDRRINRYTGRYIETNTMYWQRNIDEQMKIDRDVAKDKKIRKLHNRQKSVDITTNRQTATMKLVWTGASTQTTGRHTQINEQLQIRRILVKMII